MLTERIKVCRGARVVRILCASITKLRECLVDVILGSRKMNSRFTSGISLWAS